MKKLFLIMTGLMVFFLQSIFAQENTNAVATPSPVNNPPQAPSITSGGTPEPPIPKTSIVAAPTVATPGPTIPSTFGQPMQRTTAQPEEAQFQNWLKGNAARPQNVNSIPPPPLRMRIPPRPKRKIHIVHVHCDDPVIESPPLTYAQQKQVMLKMAPPSPQPPNPESNEAFNGMMQQNMPLSPQQVVKLRQLIDTSQRAAAIPPTIPPKPVSTTLMINLAPGSTPPAIRLAQGYISTLVFIDSAGSPWPIAAYDIGDPKIVNIQWDGKSNIMMMQAVSPYSSGNLVIRLVGLETPITLELVSGQRVVDYRTDIHVPGTGPNSNELLTGTPLPNSANQLLLNVLDGVAPPGSKVLMVRGSSDSQAWLLSDRMYFRTRFTVLSPAWIGKMSSPDGMMAYEMPKTSSVLVSQYGNPVELKVEGF